jgi:hypothetical protein
MDMVPYIFNIKPYHTDALTRPNVKHRITSATGSSYLPSGTDTPTVFIDSAQLKAMSGLQAANLSNRLPMIRTLDEQADSAARKCLGNYGPGNNPRLQIGSRNQVWVDNGGQIHLIDDIAEYKATVGPRYCMEKIIYIYLLTLC